MEDGDRENECYVATIKEWMKQGYTLETKRKPIMSGKWKTDSILGRLLDQCIKALRLY